MKLMHQEGSGVILYLKQEGRGIGLLDKLKAYNLQDLGNCNPLNALYFTYFDRARYSNCK